MGEIKMVSFNFPPKGWAFANGQLLPINQNQALFSLYGTVYGGNGSQNFGLPNLQGRSAMHVGSGFALGSTGGEATHVLTTNEIPAHTHSANASTVTDSHSPGGSVLAGGGGTEPLYSPNTTATGSMAGGVIGNAGGNQGHENLMPYQVLNFIVALQGLFPTRS